MKQNITTKVRAKYSSVLQYMKMPKKQKKIAKNFPGTSGKSMGLYQFPDGEVFRNFFAVGDDVEPRISLQYLKEMFAGKVDEDVITMVFSECAYDVGHTVETLISLSNDIDESCENSLELNDSTCSELSKPDCDSGENVNPIPLSSSEKESHECSTSCLDSSFCSSSMRCIEMSSLKNTSSIEFNCSRRINTCDPNFSFKEKECKTQSLPSEDKYSFPSNNVASFDNAIHEKKYFSEAAISRCHFSPKEVSSLSSSFYSDLQRPSLLFNTYPDHEKASFPFNFTPLHNHQSAPQFITPFLPFHTKKPVFDKNVLSDCHSMKNQKNTMGHNNELNYISNVNDISSAIIDGQPILLILRGLPGSGKSTLAKELKFSGVVLSTDDYFSRNGKYQFDSTKLGEAHSWNRKRTLDALKRKVTPIIIDNTNTEAWEMLPYVKLGLKFRYEIHILEPNTPWKFKSGKLAKKNKHKVSKEKIERMLERYDHSITVASLIQTLKNITNEDKDESLSRTLDSSEKQGDSTKTVTGTCPQRNADNCDSFSSESFAEELGDSHDGKVISLEAVVHREDSIACSEGSDKVVENDSESSKDEKGENLNSNEHIFKESDDQTLAFQGWSKIDDINKLKLLLQVESDESQGFSSTQLSSDSSQEVSGWEAITERDDDFLWSVSNKGEQSIGSTLSKGKENLVSSTENIIAEVSVPLTEYLVMPDGYDENIIQSTDDWCPKNFSLKPHDKIFSDPKPQRNLANRKSLCTSKILTSSSNSNDSETESDDKKVFDSEWTPVAYDSVEVSWNNNTVQPTVVNKNESVKPKPQRPPSGSKSINVEDSNNKAEFTQLALHLSDQTHTNVGVSEIHSNSFPIVHIPKGSDWFFPKFTGDSSLDLSVSKTKKHEVPQTNIGTQTEPCDFVLLHKLETSTLYITTMKTLKPSIASNSLFSVKEVVGNSHDLENEVCEIAHFDKSTSTSDIISDIESPDKMKILQSCFPEILDEDLKHLLEICHGDSTWLINILLEWGYKYNVPENHLEQEQLLEVASEAESSNSGTRSNSSNDIHLQGSLSVSNSLPYISNATEEKIFAPEPSNVPVDCGISTFVNSSLDERNASDKVANQVLVDPSSNDTLHLNLKLVLDPVLSASLQELFGPVSESHSGTLSESLRTINLNQNFAKILYDKWRESVLTSPVSQADLHSDASTDTDTKLPGKKIEMSDKCLSLPAVNSFIDIPREPKSLSEIMDMEYALQIHREEKLKTKNGCDAQLSVKVKRAELYRMFPGVDTLALDDVFEANNCSLEETLQALRVDIGEPAKVTPLSLPVESSELKSDILQDFITGNWSDWIHEGSLLGEEEESASLITDSTPEAEHWRAEAALHYQLRQECIGKAQSSYCRGMKDVASFYAQKGDFHAMKFKAANKRASELIIQNKNKFLNSMVLDLHGLYIQEAIPALQRFLKSSRERFTEFPTEQQTVTVVTGRGAHSLRGAKLRPSVVKYLKNAGYRFDEINLGVFNICLSSCPQV